MAFQQLPITPRKMPRSLKIATPASPILPDATVVFPADGTLIQRELEQDSYGIGSTSVDLCQLCPTAWAEILLFSGLKSVGSIAAVCTLFRNCTFEDTTFWMAYDGECCKPSPALALLSPSSMRNSVRQRKFGLEGDWGIKFAKLARTSSHAKTFAEAIPILSGIRPEDDALEAARFIGALVAQLSVFDATCSVTRKTAAAVVQQAQEQEDFLPKPAKPFARATTPLKRLQSALQASIDRAAMSEPLLDDGTSSSTSSLEESEEEETMTLCKAVKGHADCQLTSFAGFTAAAALLALLAALYVVSVLSQVVVDEGLQELAILAAVIPTGFAFVWRQRKKASAKIMGAKNKESNSFASLVRL